MFGSQALETAIGLALLFFVLAAGASVIVEALSSVLQKRAKNLEATIRDMLTGQPGTPATDPAAAQAFELFRWSCSTNPHHPGCRAAGRGCAPTSPASCGPRAPTVVLVTHDQQEALSLADRVAVPRHGRIAQEGTPRDLYTHPVDHDLTAFLGEANLVPAEIDGRTAHTALGDLHVPTSELATHAAAIVLGRPEQITLRRGHHDGGVIGAVLDQSYQGHDSLITVAADPGTGHLTRTVRVRIPGSESYPTGTPVTLAASGTVPAWSSDAIAHEGSVQAVGNTPASRI